MYWPPLAKIFVLVREWLIRAGTNTFHIHHE